MKKFLSVFLAVVMCLSFAACNSDADTSVSGDSSDVTESKSSDATEKDKISDVTDITTVTLNDTVKTEFMEMTFNEFKVVERLVCEVNTRGDNVILGEVAEGKKVAYLSGEIKNIHTDSIGNVFKSNDCIWGNICFDDKYNYDFKMYIQNGEDMQGKISPFGTGTYYLYAHIPNELLESYTACTVNFGFCENLESYDSSFGEGFSFDKCEYKYSLSVTE